MNRTRFNDLMGSMIMPDSPKKGLGESFLFSKTLSPKVKNSSRSMLEIKLTEADNDNESTLSRDDFEFNDENSIQFQEEYENEEPTEGDSLTFYKLRKKRIADRSGGALPEMPEKEKVVPLRSPTIHFKGDL